MGRKERRGIQMNTIKTNEEQCAFCGATENLQVHHWLYIDDMDMQKPWLTTLCKDCHQKLHNHGVGNGKGWTVKFVEFSKSEIELLFKEGATNGEVAKTYGVSYVTASHWRKKLGLGVKKYIGRIRGKKRGQIVKTINVSFADSEMKIIEKAKGKQSWRKFILERAAIDSSNEIHSKGINADALRGLCLEYDLKYGDYPESYYQGFDLLEFFLETIVGIKAIDDIAKHPQDRKDVIAWKERLRELEKAKENNGENHNN